MSKAQQPTGNPGQTDPAANPAIAVWESVLRYAPSFLEIDRAVSRQPGFQCAVGVDGEMLGAFSGGYAHLGQHARLTNDHLFRVASHSKTFTATAAMLLCEDGVLSLEDRLGDLLPALADSDVSGVRVGELLSHSGGIIRDSEDADFWALGRPFPPETELLEIARSAKVLERNEHFKYTNIGYGLLGLVIEAASGQDYAEFVNQRILAPLELENTGVDLDGRARELAAGYGPLVLAGRDHALDARTEIEHIHTGALAAATGFYSTASDMVAYFASHLVGAAPSVISDESKRLMQRKVEDSGVAGRGYGLGLILQKVQDRDTFGHSGGYPGHITRSWVVPETGVVLSVLSNAVDGAATAWGEKLFALAALAEQKTPESYKGIGPDTLARFTGRFAALWGLQDVVELGGKLFLLEPGAAVDPKTAAPLEFVDECTLKSADPNGFGGYRESVRFEFDERGASALRGPGGLRFVRQEDFALPKVLGLAN
ncbi:serine hydrolase domain-containing protein [Paeniglutamicibacter kerguelensis]|uniref:CubicO group peptidase (Beta-lactamase class C family) n=1 Tax=Paeniglutamicibacter kerguelensis TaxID=254788 RepID=A0ABS4XFK0_9MICC|nr:serine hydrolase domain-containing protein [Paeniglutamicibacter kerguelensis]MBP2387053.1 CubicO group peptidase (beta-lactamase class C family) [Paeniglutamicibacter kerguelensis]